jgi:hypothetical protein
MPRPEAEPAAALREMRASGNRSAHAKAQMPFCALIGGYPRISDAIRALVARICTGTNSLLSSAF